MRAIQHFKPAVFLILFMFSHEMAVSQNDPGQLRYAYTPQGTYMYHLEQVPIGDAFNVYRMRSGETEFNQINETPIKGVYYPDELQSYLGDLYPVIRENLEADTAEEVFFTLRSGTIMGRLYTFVYPEVAEALGRLFIDETVQPGETVTYRIEFVDDLERPTGNVLEETITITETTAPWPENIVLTNEGFNLEISWEYPVMDGYDDHIIRFDLFEKNPGSDELKQINDKLILRDNQRTQYSYFFSTNRLGVEKEYVVVPVSITGAWAGFGEPVSYIVEDNIAPNVVQQVEGYLRDGAIEMTWLMSPDPDLAGYRVYRSRDLSQEADLITDQLIGPDITSFVDSTIQEGNVFLYQIAAVDQSGNESKLSAAAMIRVEDQTAPDMPMGIAARYLENGAVEVEWEPGPLPSDFKRFNLYRRKISDRDSTIYDRISADEFTETIFVDNGISNIGFEEGAIYEYGIQAADSSDNFSEIAVARIQIPDVTPPEPPALVMGKNVDGIRIEVSWLNSTSSDVVSYNLFREEDNSGQVMVDTFDRSERTYNDENVRSGAGYRYAVSAMDSSGNVSNQVFSEYIQAATSDPPRQVRNVRILRPENRTELHWEPVPSTNLVGYRVYRSQISNGVYELLTEELVTETRWILTGEGNRFWYRVRAVDSSGNESRPSEPVRM